MTRVQRKRTVLLRRQEVMDRASFGRHWLTDHAALALRLPGLVRYVQNHVIRELFCLTGRWCGHDGIAEITYADDEALARAQSGHLGTHLLPADERRFLSEWTGMVTSPSKALDPAASSKTILLLNPRDRLATRPPRLTKLRRVLPPGAQIEAEMVQAVLSRVSLPADPIRPQMIVYIQGLEPDPWRERPALRSAVADLVGPLGDAVAYQVDERVLCGS